MNKLSRFTHLNKLLKIQLIRCIDFVDLNILYIKYIFECKTDILNMGEKQKGNIFHISS